jgi:general secretion pathway protein G
MRRITVPSQCQCLPRPDAPTTGLVTRGSGLEPGTPGSEPRGGWGFTPSGAGLRDHVPGETRRNGSRPPAPRYPAGHSAHPASCPHPSRRTVTLAERGGPGGAQGDGGWVGGCRPPRTNGFTLIELIIVVAIIGILATIAVPAMRTAPQRAREAALREDLFTIRSCLDQFHADRGRYPASLDEMVSMGYLRSMPVDPVTRSKDTWAVVYEEVSPENQEGQEQSSPGIIDVHSGSDQVALDGTKYADW